MLRSPAAGAAAVGRLHPSMTECFETLIAARLPQPARSTGHAGPLAAAVGGVVGHVYVRWITGGGRGDLGVAIEAAFDALAQHLPTPQTSRRRSAPSFPASD
jgi:AcrR family transcriptional regulator